MSEENTQEEKNRQAQETAPNEAERQETNAERTGGDAAEHKGSVRETWSALGKGQENNKDNHKASGIEVDERGDQREQLALGRADHKEAIRETWSGLDSKSDVAAHEAGATLHQAGVESKGDMSNSELGNLRPSGHGGYDQKGVWRSMDEGGTDQKSPDGTGRPIDKMGSGLDAKTEVAAREQGTRLRDAGVESSEGMGRPALATAEVAAEQSSQKNGYGYLDTRRAASEAAAQETMGNGATNLDAGAEGLGHRGNNFPKYDISSRDEVASVKTHWNEKSGELTEREIGSYKRDFYKVAQSTEKDGANMVAASENGVDVPEGIKNKTPQEAAEYLRTNGTLRVPDDHVEPVRRAVEADARRLPSNYGLKEEPDEAEIAAVGQRVQGIGVTSHELREIDERQRRR